MRHSLNFSTLILVLRGYSAWQLKLFCNEEKLNFSTSTHVLESVYVPGDTISGMSKVNTKAIKKHFPISKILYCLEKITILPNLWSISFIGNGSLFFITQY